ncbi:MAG: glucose-6-phosphate isomerase [SAR202 cluster bacterium]|nr:glucose-6-phosphate isomerase [SAR202 cluster bacterium]
MPTSLRINEIVERIWRRDYTIWKPSPEEISNRLGWLDVPVSMQDHVEDIAAFANEVRSEGYRHVVLLGMGGSSLGPEVLRQSFGRPRNGYPDLIVLDSVVPAAVIAVTDLIDPSRTLFVVSSKSGGTIEPNSLYRHFRAVVEKAVGMERAGRGFVAITDPGTPLERMAQEHGFRRAFVNPPDVGGRYSVLSYFGLVPAALIGLDVNELLARAVEMRARCEDGRDNPGAEFGQYMGENALAGRDKLTLITSPSVSSFGLWVEQLVAESTGKEGKGIVPVAGESRLDAQEYGEGRCFVYVWVEGDANVETDKLASRLADAGKPLLRLDLKDAYDLGAEFYRWEFATATAGAMLGVNPFDQPDVQRAKEMASEMIAEFRKTGRLPEPEGAGSFESLVRSAGAGDYFAVLAFMRETPYVDTAFTSLRKALSAKLGVATTLGYGPRYLHSTGQLHKGGPAGGVFLLVTAEHPRDLPVPGEQFTFATLADAQALGDYLTLREKGRRVARVHLTSNLQSAIARMTDTL